MSNDTAPKSADSEAAVYKTKKKLPAFVNKLFVSSTSIFWKYISLSIYLILQRLQRKRLPVPPGWVQDRREKTGPENLHVNAQAMEGEKVKTTYSP